MAFLHDFETSGKRLLPHVVDGRVASGYARPFAMYPRTRDPADGFQSISYARMANAINRVRWWIESELLQPDEKKYPFAYMGTNDLRYIIFLLAIIKTGRKVLTLKLAL
jgi:acyl-CoA synthetase (AMP-forming)/AMP-acid ligase II